MSILSKIVYGYLFFSGFNYLFSYHVILADYNFITVTILSLLLSSYLVGSFLVFRGKKIGYQILIVSLFLSTIGIETNYLSYNISTAFDILFFFNFESGLGLDLHLGGRFALGVFDGRATNYTQFIAIDLISSMLLFFVIKDFKQKFILTNTD